MADTFHLVIASVAETRFDGPAISATLPGAEGEFTVLPHHESVIAILKKGTITLKDTQGELKRFDIESGVVEVNNNRAVVLL